MQRTFSGARSLEAYVALVESLENATMVQDTTREVLDFDDHQQIS